MSAVPKCQHCGKPLYKFRVHESLKAGSPAPTEYVGRRVLEVTKKSPSTLWDWYELWLGDWGYLGNGRFCTLRCGYWWACRRCPPAEAAS